MASTLLLDVAQWDLTVDAQENIAVAEEPYALAQDAASAAKTFLGEVFWDTTVGVPFMQEILSRNPTVAIVKQRMVEAALTVLGVISAKFFLTALTERLLTGQLQVSSATSGHPIPINFTVVNPQV